MADEEDDISDDSDDMAEESDEARQSLIISFIIEDEDESEEEGCR